MKKRTLEDWDEIREARRQCSARPAVDWQAAYRALAAERAASPPQSARGELADLHKLISSMQWPTEAQLVVEGILDEIKQRARGEVSASPPQEVVAAAKRIGELAAAATEGPWAEVVWYGTDEGGWAAVGPHHTGADDECDDDASDSHARAEADAAFIAECRTLAPLLAEWVNGGGK